MYWDSSALVALLLDEPNSRLLVDRFNEDTAPALWWGTALECHAAVVRAVRDKRLDREESTYAGERLKHIRTQVREVLPVEGVRTRAMRLLSAHSLRSADSLQLAAALLWCEEQPTGETFVSLDQRLRDAAKREGFSLLPEET